VSGAFPRAANRTPGPQPTSADSYQFIPDERPADALGFKQEFFRPGQLLETVQLERILTGSSFLPDAPEMVQSLCIDLQLLKKIRPFPMHGR
jgi:hypothetical protein